MSTSGQRITGVSWELQWFQNLSLVVLLAPGWSRWFDLSYSPRGVCGGQINVSTTPPTADPGARNMARSFIRTEITFPLIEGADLGQFVLTQGCVMFRPLFPPQSTEPACKNLLLYWIEAFLGCTLLHRARGNSSRRPKYQQQLYRVQQVPHSPPKLWMKMVLGSLTTDKHTDICVKRFF